MPTTDQPTPQDQLTLAGIDLDAIRQIVQTGHREDQVRALLQRFGALRRQDLAYLCQVNTTTAGRAVRALLDQGLLREELLAPPGQRRTSWLIWYTYATPTDDHLTGLVHLLPLICQGLYPDDVVAESSAAPPTDPVTADTSEPTSIATQTRVAGAAAQDGEHTTRDTATTVDADTTPHMQPTDPLPVATSLPAAPALSVPPAAAPDPSHVPIARTLQRVLQREGIPRMALTNAAKSPALRRNAIPWLRRTPYHWGLLGFVVFWFVLLLTQLPLPLWSWPIHTDVPAMTHDQVPPPAQRLLPPSSPNAPPTIVAPRTGIVTGTGDQGLIVRDAAGARIGHLAEGTVVTIQDDPVTRPDPQHPQWWPIQFHDRTGYVSTEYVILEASLP